MSRLLDKFEFRWSHPNPIIKYVQESCYKNVESNGLFLFAFRFFESPVSPLRVSSHCTVPIVCDDGVGPIRIDYSCSIAVMYSSGMSAIRIDYSCSIAVMYSSGMSAI